MTFVAVCGNSGICPRPIAKISEMEIQLIPIPIWFIIRTYDTMNYHKFSLITLISITMIGLIAIPIGNPKFLNRAIALELCFAFLSFFVWRGYTKGAIRVCTACSGRNHRKQRCCTTCSSHDDVRQAFERNCVGHWRLRPSSNANIFQFKSNFGKASNTNYPTTKQASILRSRSYHEVLLSQVQLPLVYLLPSSTLQVVVLFQARAFLCLYKATKHGKTSA